MSEACVILNDIHIDIMDYIKPAYCNEAQVSNRFRGGTETEAILGCSSGVCGLSSSGKIGLT
jgi:hypothetical protein